MIIDRSLIPEGTRVVALGEATRGTNIRVIRTTAAMLVEAEVITEEAALSPLDQHAWYTYIGENDRLLTTDDMRIAIRINRIAECVAVFLIVIIPIIPFIFTII